MSATFFEIFCDVIQQYLFIFLQIISYILL